MEKEKQLVFGHKNPDTDTIASAVAYSYLLNKIGYNTEPVALGEPNDETKFVFQSFACPLPRIIDKINGEVKSVILVDHNEPQQSVDDLNTVEVTNVIDHHRIAGFETKNPLYYRAEPLGCVSTILVKLFAENAVEIPLNLAGVMLGAIISDTLLLKSPTTTDEDINAAKALAEIADIDFHSFGIEELKAGTNLGAKSDLELVRQDAKSFDMNGVKVRVDQINTVDLNEVFDRQDGLEKAMAKDAKENGYNLFLVLATDVLENNSCLLVWGEHKDKVEIAFNGKLNNNTMDLPGVVSRKKQVIPPLENAFKN